MSSHINLMSPRARVQECSRTRMRQWLRILAAVVGGIVLHASITWWPAYINSQQCALLETRYGPLRQMKETNKALTAQIANTHDKSKLELALSRQTPVLTLVGLVSQAVAASEGSVYLEQISYSQDNDPGEATGDSLTQVGLEGYSADPAAIEHLAESLRIALPFADVRLEPIKQVQINASSLNAFQIECSF
jgi:hypothetical protein